MSEHCPDPSCGRPIPADQAFPWCFACGARFPESLQLRLPKLQEAKSQARLADGGPWVEETCVRCRTHFRTLALRDFLGFRERECPNCHQLTVSPLSGSYRLTYWIFFGFFSFSFAQVFRQGTDPLDRGAFLAFLLLVALTWAICKDLRIVYRLWSSRREGNDPRPGEAAGLGGEQPASDQREAQSLRSQWWTGFLTVLGCWFMVLWMFGLIDRSTSLFYRDDADSSTLLFALKCGAYLILNPLIISALRESGLKLAQLWSSWLRGFKTLLIGFLVVLPSLLLHLVGQGTMRIVDIEKGSPEEHRLTLLVLLMSIVLVPFCVAPLFRWLSRSPLAEQASWFNERLSQVSGYER